MKKLENCCKRKNTDPIKLFLISGFLGAGKTTLLTNILESTSGLKVGVIVNEFGSLGVDGKVVSKSGIELVEFNNGSIFCSCLKVDFVKGLKAFTESDIDLLIIENSGLADPSGMNLILAGLAPYVERQYVYHGAVCLVDCNSFLDLYETLVALKKQVETADFVLLNKTDLCSSETLEQLHAVISKINPKVNVFNTIFAEIPYDFLIGGLKNHNFSGESSNTPSTRSRAYICEAEGNLNTEGLHSFLEELCPKTYRVKGFSQTESGYLHIDCVGKSVKVVPAANVDEIGFTGTKLIIISQRKTELFSDIKTIWAATLGVELKLTAE